MKTFIPIDEVPAPLVPGLPASFKADIATASGTANPSVRIGYPQPKPDGYPYPKPGEKKPERSPKVFQIVRHKRPVEVGSLIREYDPDMLFAGKVVGSIIKTGQAADSSFISVAAFYEPVDLTKIAIEHSDGAIALAARRKSGKRNVFDLTVPDIEEQTGIATASSVRVPRNVFDLTA